jgi:pyruvate/2-oxoglutarate dehydrogenase complex dihydrolipoamide acyltransferase (E2) component
MAIELKMPALSPTMEEGTLAKWLVKEGDTVKSGDILAEIETDKATMEFEAVDEGTIAKILIAEGTDNVKVGTVIATIAGEDEDASAPAPAAAPAPTPAPAAKEAEPAAGEDGGPKKADSGTKQLASDKAATVKDPAIPEGTEMVKTTVREALRDAMAEEMRKPMAAFRDGRGSRRISGRLQGDPGPARGVRPEARDRYADHRVRLCRPRHGRGDGRPQADRRVHDLQLRDAGDRPHRELGRQDQLYVRRPDALPDRVPRPERRREPRRRAALAELWPLVRQRPGPDRDRPL